MDCCLCSQRAAQTSARPVTYRRLRVPNSEMGRMLLTWGHVKSSTDPELTLWFGGCPGVIPQRQPQVEPPLTSQVRPCVSALEHPEQAEESSGPMEQPASGTPCPSALLWRKQAPAGFKEAPGREFGQGYACHGLWVGWSGGPNTTFLAHW